MMKRLLAASILAASPMIALAGSGPGCGFGSMVFEGKTGPVNHILAATTNSLFGNQTFGMTSGTAGCNVDENIEIAAQFLDSNIDQVAENMATGEGEVLEAFAELLGVSVEDYPVFARTVQQNFDNIFIDENVTSDAVLEATLAVMANDATLNKYSS